MLRLGVALYKDFELLDVYGPLEMFGSLGEDIQIVTIAEEAGPVASTQGPKTVAEESFASAPQLDLLLVPGGIGTVPELDNPAYLEFLRDREREAQTVMSVCSGSALLARAGLLDGKRATSNKMFFSLATSQSDAVEWVEAARWVADGKMVTSSGVSAGTDMALAVIADLFGEERAEQVAAYTEYQSHKDPNADPFVAYLNQGALADA
ncbi:MAG: DJ-1/PfpI family protein [Gammaproteobacteria bacterium]|nr:DJ-1/PfpI family protein [Gammaproteobacteria bacterium]